MAIRIEQPGASESAARAGSIIGKGQRAAEDRARAEREMVRKEEEKARAKAQKVSLEWELQKMADQSRRAYEREMRQEDYRLAAEDRAAAWEIEKMELTSRHDFEQEEQERMQNLARIDAKILALKKAQEDKQFTGREPEYQSMLFNLEQQKYGIKNPRALAKEAKPRSAASQVSEINATYELQGYTAEDLREAGLDPDDFPGIATNESGYSIGQIVATPKGNVRITGFDADGEPEAELITPANTRNISGAF